MPLTNSTVSQLSLENRQVLTIWLTEFDGDWDEGRLADRARALPWDSPLRLPALIEMVKIDLRRHWLRGRRLEVEAYLRDYPELGTRDTVAAELLLAEFEARSQCGAPAVLADFVQRFPARADELAQLLEQSRGLADTSPNRQPAEQTLDASSLTPAAGSGSGSRDSLPEQFGRYRIVRKLGQGGMGAVYLAHDTQLDRQVALKVPSFASHDGGAAVERFYREARAAATIRHVHICPVYDVGRIDSIHYFTMAYVEGQPLTELVKATPRPSPVEIAVLIHKLALALEEAHRQGVIHRDLKPSNIMIDCRGEPVIMDFGLARRMSKADVRLTGAGDLLGTPAYMSPEQVSSDVDNMGPACDIYTLGVILYELLTGRLPFEGSLGEVMSKILTQQAVPPSSLRPEADPRLEAVCLKAMAKKASDRYGTMGAMAQALGDYLASRSQATVIQQDSLAAAPPLKPPAVARRRLPLRWLGIATAAAAALLIWGITVLVSTKHGTIKIELDDPQAKVEIKVDGELIEINGLDKPLRLQAGEHKLLVTGTDFESFGDSFTVKRGDNPVLHVSLVPKKLTRAPETSSGEASGKRPSNDGSISSGLADKAARVVTPKTGPFRSGPAQKSLPANTMREARGFRQAPMQKASRNEAPPKVTQGTVAPVSADSINLAAVENGGVLVDVPAEYNHTNSAANNLLVGPGKGCFEAPGNGAISIVLGFKDGRPGRITHVAVNPRTNGDKKDWVRQVQVEVSTTYPFAGFQSIGAFEVPPGPDDTVFGVDPPREARFVRFTFLKHDGGRYLGARELSVMGTLLPAQPPPQALDDLALTSLGGKIVRATSEYYHSDWKAANLLAGGPGPSWEGDSGASQVVVLQLGKPTLVHHIAINPYSSEETSIWAKEAEVFLSDTDAITGFKRLGTLQLEAIGRDHVLSSLPSPTAAKYVKVVFVSNRGGRYLAARSIKVFGTAIDTGGGKDSASSDEAIDLAAQANGGTLIDVPAQYDNAQYAAKHLLANSRSGHFEAPGPGAISVVVGFKDKKAARIAAVAVNPYMSDSPTNWVKQVEVEISNTYPFSGFSKVGTLDLSAVADDGVLRLQTPQVGRYVRFSLLKNGGGRYLGANQLMVLGTLLPDTATVPELKNAALKANGSKVLKVSSEYDGNDWKADNLIDGNPGRSWQGTTGDSQSVVIQLGARGKVRFIAVNPYCRDNPNTWVREIELFLSDTDPLTGFKSVGKLKLDAIGRDHTLELSEPRSAKYVKALFLSNGGGRYMAAHELKVFVESD